MVLQLILFTALAIAMGISVYRRSLRQQMGIDTMNVYRLRMCGVPLFTTLRRFVNAFGLPPQANFRGATYPVKTIENLNLLTRQADQTGYELFLYYDGIEMNYYRGGGLVISSIDFRKTEHSIEYRGRVFDRMFGVSEFRELFPLSAAQEFYGSALTTLFELKTSESSCGTDSYMVHRWSRTNIFAQPTVEFTFKDGRLIYIFFANF